MITIPTATKMKNLTHHHRPTLTTSICLALGHLHLLLKKRFRGRVQLRVEPLPSYSMSWWYCWWLWCIYGDDSAVNEYELARTCLPCICVLEDKIWRRSSMQSGSCSGLLMFYRWSLIVHAPSYFSYLIYWSRFVLLQRRNTRRADSVNNEFFWNEWLGWK